MGYTLPLTQTTLPTHLPPPKHLVSLKCYIRFSHKQQFKQNQQQPTPVPPHPVCCSAVASFSWHTQKSKLRFSLQPHVRAAGTTATLVFSPFPKGCTSKLLHFSKCTLQILLGLFLSFFKAIPPKAFALYPKHFSKCLVHFSKCFFTCWSLTSCLGHEKLPCLKAA